MMQMMTSAMTAVSSMMVGMGRELGREVSLWFAWCWVDESLRKSWAGLLLLVMRCVCNIKGGKDESVILGAGRCSLAVGDVFTSIKTHILSLAVFC